MKRKVVRSSRDAFSNLGFLPHEASVVLLRAQLAEALLGWMEREGLTQAQAAKPLGIGQPRVSDIVRNKVELMSLDYLLALCAKAKVDVGLRLAA
jgi:predicted XRE-type DNA-binding protein